MIERTQAIPTVRMVQKIADALTIDPASHIRTEESDNNIPLECNISRFQKALDRKPIAIKRVVIRMLEGSLLYNEQEDIIEIQ